MLGRGEDKWDEAAAVDEEGAEVDEGVEAAVVTASQNAARPGSVEQAPHVLGSPVHTGSAGDSVKDQSFLPVLLLEESLSERGMAAVAEPWAREDSGVGTVYQSFFVFVLLR